MAFATGSDVAEPLIAALRAMGVDVRGLRSVHISIHACEPIEVMTTSYLDIDDADRKAISDRFEEVSRRYVLVEKPD